MKIKILGSGGGEGYPAMFCGCDHCNAARLSGGKSIRTLHQTLINDDLLVDLPPDTAEHARKYDLNLGDIPNVLITHVHFDHFQPFYFCCRGGVYAHNIKSPTVTVHGSADVKEKFELSLALFPMNKSIRDNIILNELTPFTPTEIGAYTVTALPAKHAVNDLRALNYVIERNGSALIYLHDTGYPYPEVLDYLEKNFRNVGAVMLDATMGVMDNPDSSAHMSFEQDKRLAADLISRGIASENTRFIANHITHNKAETHEKIEEIFKDTLIEVAYDGLEFEI